MRGHKMSSIYDAVEHVRAALDTGLSLEWEGALDSIVLRFYRGDEEIGVTQCADDPKAVCDGAITLARKLGLDLVWPEAPVLDGY